MANKSDWIEYWGKPRGFMIENMRKNREIFLKNSTKFLHFTKKDVVLDIGCGVGLIEEFIKDKVKEVHCLEVSYYNLCVLKKKFGKSKNIHIWKLNKENYTDLSFLGRKKFAIVLLISVVQYFRDVGDLIRLINEVKKVCTKGLFLITDIKTKEGLFADALGVLKTGLREKYLIRSLTTLILGYLTEYRQVLKHQGLLVISEAKLKEIVRELKLNANIIKTPLSIDSERRHLLVRL